MASGSLAPEHPDAAVELNPRAERGLGPELSKIVHLNAAVDKPGDGPVHSYPPNLTANISEPFRGRREDVRSHIRLPGIQNRKSVGAE
ncbi:hypothetical protein [Streptomyces monomycini]|uniref:hypothetical protein n=1 Tax=Streptomyces monomycini TaxID=371720 RepID=UPI0012FECB10|nr:hypothetical protein [Streptomyces monomycini]